MKCLFKYLTKVIPLAVITLALTGCNSQKVKPNHSHSNNQLQVVTTFYPIYEFTNQVVGANGTVEMLIPAGTEPHDYEPSAKDVAKIVDSDIFIYNSKNMENWVDQILKNVDQSKTLVVDASKGIEMIEFDPHEEESNDHDHDHGTVDPHIWLDPVRAQQQVTVIEKALSKKNSEFASSFSENAETYRQELKKLNNEYEMAFKSAKNRVFVTQHTAFAYLADRYKLTQESIAGLDPEQEPSPARLATLKRYVEANDINVIYHEASSSSKIANVLAQETGIKLEELNSLEGMTEQQLANGEDYLSVMRQNLRALQQTIK